MSAIDKDDGTEEEILKRLLELKEMYKVHRDELGDEAPRLEAPKKKDSSEDLMMNDILEGKVIHYYKPKSKSHRAKSEPRFSELQNVIVQTVEEHGGFCHIETIIEYVRLKWPELRRRDGTVYHSSDCRKVVYANLRGLNLYNREGYEGYWGIDSKWDPDAEHDENDDIRIWKSDDEDLDIEGERQVPITHFITQAIEERNGVCELQRIYDHVLRNWTRPTLRFSMRKMLTDDEIKEAVQIALRTDPNYLRDPSNPTMFSLSTSEEKRAPNYDAARPKKLPKTRSPVPSPVRPPVVIDSRARNKKNACPVCGKVYRNNESELDDNTWIRCDDCHRWVMTKCDGIKDLSLYDDDNPNHLHYSCPVCRQEAPQREEPTPTPPSTKTKKEKSPNSTQQTPPQASTPPSMEKPPKQNGQNGHVPHPRKRSPHKVSPQPPSAPQTPSPAPSPSPSPSPISVYQIPSQSPRTPQSQIPSPLHIQPQSTAISVQKRQPSPRGPQPGSAMARFQNTPPHTPPLSIPIVTPPLAIPITAIPVTPLPITPLLTPHSTTPPTPTSATPTSTTPTTPRSPQLIQPIHPIQPIPLSQPIHAIHATTHLIHPIQPSPLLTPNAAQAAKKPPLPNGTANGVHKPHSPRDFAFSGINLGKHKRETGEDGDLGLRIGSPTKTPKTADALFAKSAPVGTTRIDSFAAKSDPFAVRTGTFGSKIDPFTRGMDPFAGIKPEPFGTIRPEAYAAVKTDYFTTSRNDHFVPAKTEHFAAAKPDGTAAAKTEFSAAPKTDPFPTTAKTDPWLDDAATPSELTARILSSMQVHPQFNPQSQPLNPSLVPIQPIAHHPLPPHPPVASSAHHPIPTAHTPFNSSHPHPPHSQQFPLSVSAPPATAPRAIPVPPPANGKATTNSIRYRNTDDEYTSDDSANKERERENTDEDADSERDEDEDMPQFGGSPKSKSAAGDNKHKMLETQLNMLRIEQENEHDPDDMLALQLELFYHQAKETFCK